MAAPDPAGPGARVYGPDRVRRLRIALGVASGLAVLLAAFVFSSSVARADAAPGWIAGTAVGVLTALGCLLAMRMLSAAPDRRAKVLVVTMGAVLVLVALMTGPVIVISLPFALLGLAVLFLSLTADEVP